MGHFLFMTAGFLLNTALASHNVSKRRHGWAAAYALSAVWCIVFAARVMPS